MNYVIRTATTTPITVTAEEAAAGATIYIKMVTPGPIDVFLPIGVTGYQLMFKDGTGDAMDNRIAVHPVAGTIDGAASDVIAANYGARTYLYTGTEWSNV